MANNFLDTEAAAAELRRLTAGRLGSSATLERWRRAGVGPRWRRLGRKCVVYDRKALSDYVSGRDPGMGVVAEGRGPAGR